MRIGCFEVKSQGDGFMIASQSARRGSSARSASSERSQAITTRRQEPIQVRIGLHTGEVLKDADDFFGKHVILASRIANQAQGGEILVSSSAQRVDRKRRRHRLRRQGRDVELKGLAGTYRDTRSALARR